MEQIDPHNIVLYRSVYTGEQIDTLLGLIRPSKTLAEGLDARVKVIEDKLSPKVVLTIQQMDFIGGTNIQSPAGGEVIAVEDLPRGYKCYFDTNNGSEPVLFHVNDQAMGRRYDLGTTDSNYYWRLVTEVGDDYIVLSKTDCDPGSGAPAIGDKVITVGNRYDVQRQNVKISTTIGENRDEWYAGISSYNLDNKLVTVVGVKDGKVGIWTENGYFAGEIHITNGEGLENLDEWQAIATQISDAWEKAVKAEADAANAQYTADAAALQAERIELHLELINSDTVLDIAEKKVIRTEWITINGREELDRAGDKGSYYRIRHLFDQYSNLGKSGGITYDGKALLYNGIVLTYKFTGVSALDAAYLALREYLREVSLNDRTSVYEGFDRQHLADLLTAYRDAERAVSDAIDQAITNRIEQAKAEVLTELGDFQTAVERQLEEVKDIVDNTIETWFMDGAPSLVSPPASDWTTDELKERHLGDLYYDNLTGYAYRFQYNGEKYYWHYIEDSALAKALAAAAKAQDTADGKRRVFLSQPTAADAYDRGDLWLHATIGDYHDETLVCMTAKTAGASFSAAHWTTASKYTDDTVANQARQEAAAAQETADDAQRAAAAAQTAADDAQATADAAAARLDGWAADGVISPLEKEALRQQRNDIQTEYGDILAQAIAYGLDTTTYTSIYEAALAALIKYSASTPENITIGSDYATITDYYTARSTILQAIAAAAKQAADDARAAANAAQATADRAGAAASAAQAAADAAQAAADNAQAAADAAQAAADTAQATADAATTRLNNWASDGVISPPEKEALRQQLKDIQTEKTDILAQAASYGVSSTTYNTAATRAIAALTKYTAASPENITIESDYTTIADYYDTRSTILQAIAAAAKQAADDAQAAADAAQATADAAMTAAGAAQVAANAAQAAANAAQRSADDAQAAADDAQAAADAAQATADAATTRLNNWASDGVISPPEKEALRQQLKDIQTEKDDISAQALAYGVSDTSYTIATNRATAALTKYSAATPENITIEADYAYIAAYYDARSLILQATADAAKQLADDAQAAADAAQAAADAAQAAADTAQSTANDAYRTATGARDAADAAQRAADAAQDAADDAQATADANALRLNNWASDGVISPLEKEALRQQKNNITEEYAGLRQQALSYSISTTAYDNAYDAALAALTKYSAASPEVITIGSDYASIATYYAARTTISEAIAAAAKAAAAQAQATADQAIVQAVELRNVLEQLNSDTVLDIAEKKVIRTEWITINGIEELDRAGSRGSYYQTKHRAAKYSDMGAAILLTYKGKNLLYNGVVLSYKYTGLAALDAAYLALREYLREVGLNDRTRIFEGFDRQRLASLLTAYYDAESAADDATTAAIRSSIDQAKAQMLAELTTFQDAVEQQLEEVKDIVDNTIETWFLEGVPTLSNAPASGWTTAADKESHLGDLYYDILTGLAYRFQIRNGSEYYWYQMQDSAVAQALAAAAKAQDTADGKRRVFLSQPTTADTYDRGDLWLHATIGSFSNETLVCLTAKASGTAFSASHWGAASKYTDDTVANQARQEAATAQNAANAAQTTADNARTAADTAQAAANAANTRLDGWASDGVISPLEKESLRQQLKDIQTEAADIITQAGAYDISVTAYRSAWTAAVTALNKYTAKTPENITIGTDYADISAYYDARSAILQAIAAAAKQAADDAQEAADAAMDAAEVADGKAEAAARAAAEAAEAISRINADDILDPFEKGEIRTTWIGINGTVSTTTHGKTGTYAAAKEALAAASAAAFPSVLMYKGKALLYNGVVLTYNILGEGALDAAYLALREYVNAVQINAPGYFMGFSREYYSELLRDYHVALQNVQKTLSDIATQKADANTARLDEWASDGVISPLEKEALRQQKNDIVGEYQQIHAQAVAYSIATAAYDNAYADALAALNKYTAKTPEVIPVASDYGAIAVYYNARTTITQAIANATKTAADDAKDTADAAADRLDGWAADGVISPLEKEALRQQKNDIVGEHNQILQQASAYTISTTAYVSAYNAAVTALDKYTARTPENITIGNDYANIAAYYTARTTILQAIANAAKSATDGALSSIETINAALEKMGSDNYISAQEKLTLKTALQDEDVVHTTLTRQAARYNTVAVENALTAYESMYRRFGDLVTYYCENFPWADDVPISADYPLTIISNYYTVRGALVDAINVAEKAILDTKANNSDYNYLKEALPANAFTQVTGGLVLANILGVKNAAGNVVAAMNGLASITGFNHATHGVLMFAAGITSVATAKDTAATRIFADGTIYTNKLNATGGKISDLIVKKTRNPFSEVTDSFDAIDDDTVYSYTLSGHLVGTLDWTPDSSGRRLVLAGSFSISAPSGKYFYENGRKHTELKSSKEITELLGFGTASVFRGWIVMNRQLFQTTYNFGRTITPLAFGKVVGSASSAYFSIVKYMDDGSRVNENTVISVERAAVGEYNIYVPQSWFVDANYIYMDLTGVGHVVDSSEAPEKATLGPITTDTKTVTKRDPSTGKTTTTTYQRYKITILLSDDATKNDGSFLFRLYNMAQWDD